MGYVTDDEATRLAGAGSTSSQAAGRVVRDGDRWFAAEASRDPKAVLRGRLEALGPVQRTARDRADAASCSSSSRREGAVLRTRIDGREAWCDRRLLARIQRYTLDRLRREIEPVTAAEFLRFLACWQHVDPEHRLEGPRGVAEVVRQLAGFEVPAARVGGERPARARARLPARVARPADALGRGRVGAALGLAARRRCAATPDRPRPARGPRPAWLVARGARGACARRGPGTALEVQKALADARRALLPGAAARDARCRPPTSSWPGRARRARPRRPATPSRACAG